MSALISIYIPTKNRVDFLKKAIQSVIDQTYENWELIVINDASTDKTKDYLDKLVLENSKIKAIHHTESQGACVSRNDAIFSARGEFITGLDDDDEFTTDRLSIFVNAWEKKESEVIALCAYKDCMINGVYETTNYTPEIFITADSILYRNLVGNQIYTRLDNLKDIGGFDSDFKMWQDYNCWYRLLQKGGKIKKLPLATYIWERSDRDDRITQNDRKKVMSTYRLFVKKCNLNFKQANILKFTLLDYRLRAYNWAFYFEMVFGTLFDGKTVTKVNNEFLKPRVYNFLKKIYLVK